MNYIECYCQKRPATDAVGDYLTDIDDVLVRILVKRIVL